MNDSIIVEKGKRMQSSINFTLEEHERTNISFSNWWLHTLKRRHGFRRYKSQGESGSADEEEANAVLLRLRALAVQY